MVKTVVMPKMTESLGWLHGVCSAMYERIHQIAAEEPWEKPKSQVWITHDPEYQIKNTEKSACHDQTRDRRHQQPFLIPWELMVGTMHDKVKPLGPLGFCYPVEQVAMEHILGKSPHEYSAYK